MVIKLKNGLKLKKGNKCFGNRGNLKVKLTRDQFIKTQNTKGYQKLIGTAQN